MIKIVIPGRLPGLNEYINAERSNKYAAAGLKKNTQTLICLMIKTQVKDKISTPVWIHYDWYEPNKKRDKDNIAFAQKFVQDALVKCGVLKNDGWNDIDGFDHSFHIDEKNPRVEIKLLTK